MTQGAYLGVARFRKPHGLKGEAVVWVMTDEPETVFAVGQRLTPISDDGHPLGVPLTIERARPYHRLWLLKFEEIDERSPLEQWNQTVLGVPRTDLSPPGDGEMYAHEIPGSRVVADGQTVGVAKELLDVPGGRLLSVDVDGKEVLVPFRRPILVSLNRADRVIEVALPPGLLEL